MSLETESHPVTKVIMPTARDYTCGQREAINHKPLTEDCYFYFYSTCAKGEGCKFRHCSAALGSEQICEQWKNLGTCKRKVCAFRHSKMLRQRSVIPCYWECRTGGCCKPHCPFMHRRVRRGSKNALLRLHEYKMATIKIKDMEELQKEREMKAEKTVTLKEEEGTGGQGELLGLRQESMKIIAAEIAAFKQQPIGQQKQVPINLPVAGGEGRMGGVASEVASCRAEVKMQHVRPIRLRIGSSSKQQRAATSHCAAAAPHTSKTQGRMRAGARLSNRNMPSTTPGAKAKTTPTNHLGMDFKIKTLEELRAERGHCSASPRQPGTRDVCVGNGEQDVKESGTGQQCPVTSEVTELGPSNKVKKVFLVRRRRLQDLHPDTHCNSDNDRNTQGGGRQDVLKVPTPDSGGQKPIPECNQQKLIPESGGQKPIRKLCGQKSIPGPGGHKHIPISGRKKLIPDSAGQKPIPDPSGQRPIPESGRCKSIPESGGLKCIPDISIQKEKSESNNRSNLEVNPHSSVGSNLKSSFDVESNSDSNTTTGLLVKRSRNQVGGGSEAKRRKVNLHRKRRRPVQEMEEPRTGVAFCSVDQLELGSVTERVNLAELKNELFGNVNGLLDADLQDKVLLEEMAQYEEEDEEPEGLGGTGLSDSKNDDELLLQMEEFM